MFKSVEEQHNWFLENFTNIRDDNGDFKKYLYMHNSHKSSSEIKNLLKELFTNDCGDFQEFLDKHISGKAYEEIMYFKSNPDSSFTSISQDLDTGKAGVSKRLHKVLVSYYNYIQGLYNSDMIIHSNIPPRVKNSIRRLGISTKDELIDYINSNGGISQCFKGARNIGAGTINIICDYLGYERVIDNKKFSDLQRFILIKEYLKDGGTDIEEIRRLVGDAE